MEDNRSLKPSVGNGNFSAADDVTTIYVCPAKKISKLRTIVVVNEAEDTEGTFLLKYARKGADDDASHVWYKGLNLPANGTGELSFSENEVDMFELDTIRIQSTVDCRAKVFAKETDKINQP